MLRDGGKIIKNGNVIFKSQVVDSYLKTTETSYTWMRVNATGLTSTSSLSFYYKTPTATLKKVYTSDMNTTVNFGTTGEGSEKSWYVCGEVEAVNSICLYGNSDRKWTGDLVGFVNEFPRIQCMDFGSHETDFNQDISYSSFPETLTCLKLYDSGLQGDTGTISGWNNLEDLCLHYTQSLSGNLHESIANRNLKSLCIYYGSNSLTPDLNCIINTSDCLGDLNIYRTCYASMCADTVDVSDMCTFCIYTTSTNNDICGNMSGWTFNTGLTQMYIGVRNICGDVTNWDFSDTQLDNFSYYNYGYYTSEISGNLSGWTLPSTLRFFTISYWRDITSLPEFSGTSLSNLNIIQSPLLSGDVTTYIFPNTIRSIVINNTSMRGNLENFDFTNIIYPNFRYNCFSGDIGEINLNTGMTQLFFDGNYFTGNIADFDIPENVTYVGLGQNPYLCLDLSTSFNTGNATQVNFGGISGITGDFNNFELCDSLSYLYLCGINISASNFTCLDTSGLIQFNASCSSISQDITPMFTGDTGSLASLYLCRNSNLSGDTTDWNISGICRVHLTCTDLCGRLCHNNIRCLMIDRTNISSCIDIDLDLSNRGYYFCANNSCIQGDISNQTLNYNCIRTYCVDNNPSLTGSNDFIDNVFTNRKNFSQSYVTIGINDIGDSVTGMSVTLGDLGTYTGDPSGMDLTEEQVNNLVAGTDYDGNGSNTPWDSKNKIWWMKNACTSSSSTARRYSTFNLSY